MSPLTLQHDPAMRVDYAREDFTGAARETRVSVLEVRGGDVGSDTLSQQVTYIRRLTDPEHAPGVCA